MLADRGISAAQWAKDNVLFTVFRAEVDYKAPACYGDTLVIETSISQIRGARLTFDYVVTNEPTGAVTVTGLTKMACVNERMRPRSIPDEIMEKLT